ncbi:fungal-specific transcription factor domain protein [Aspergillus sclerotiicarbonarius CBS 121057]|uniref:Fungal-specific transcription factor domain protein n=1 Tax=Aspergillus sclerotiicarbonarius (strain CBS 121057 / IBT 28362) TaxID=1448318 RepID=A0A319E1H0_ASPSB|nr:fungal-specific transcription factor domain protein [Aspergillus sclerotiicarbonarius CBS 121057]
MFSTFVAIPDRPESGPSQPAHPPSSIISSASSSSSSSTTPWPPRPKRSQVSRACDWCRVHRIKCDSSLPCRNCRNRGGSCTKKSSGEPRTLPHAMREIERLRQRVHELEARLASSRQSPAPHAAHPAEAPGSPSVARNHKSWEGILTRTAHSSQTQWYGPSSAFYFIGRMSAYLGAVLEQPQDDHHLQPISASRTFTSPTSPQRGSHEDEEQPAPWLADNPESGNYLTGMQEDYFLGLFWQSYHPTYQILDEAEFREHYRSLWAESATTRRSSALVDIILALCMQYGLAFAPRGEGPAVARPDSVDINDASIAGRWYYRRSQALLTSELESPSITTLQCHIFSVVYLCNASFQNMAHTTLALAVRTAHILGLHLEPPEDLPRAQRELRKRIWWTLYTVESKTCMKLGRPWSAPDVIATCQLPAHDHELARLSGSNIASYGDKVTWLTYSRLIATLILASQTVYRGFYQTCGEILATHDAKSLYADLQGLEAAAESLTTQLESLHAWLREVPPAMKTKRKDAGEPFSTDRSTLDLERYAPLWLQRQRILLELLYHNQCMNLYRPFICFPPTAHPSAAGAFTPPPYSTPVTEGHAVACLNHAMAITQILRQILTGTDILSGWYEAYQWQWNATLSLIGFLLAYPLHPATQSARTAIEGAITVLETFGNNFAIAASAANVTRGLTAKADFLIGRFGTGAGSALMTPFSGPVEGLLADGECDPLLLADAPSAMFQNTLAGAMGLAYDVDSFYSFEPLYAGSRNLADAWVFSQD